MHFDPIRVHDQHLRVAFGLSTGLLGHALLSVGRSVKNITGLIHKDYLVSSIHSLPILGTLESSSLMFTRIHEQYMSGAMCVRLFGFFYAPHNKPYLSFGAEPCPATSFSPNIK